MKIRSVGCKKTAAKKTKTTRNVSKQLLTASDADEIFRQLNQLWPNAQCELLFNTPFQLLLAVILSAQTTDKAVNKALSQLLARRPDFAATDLIGLGERRFLGVIKSIGLAPSKARNSVAMARQLVSLHDGQVPMDRQALEDLPGVGRKTANVVLNVLGGLPTMAVDTHVARVSVRLGLVRPTANRLQIEDELLKIVPSEWGVQAHHLLIFHGRYHCTARSPKCLSCPINRWCKKVGVDTKDQP